MSPTAPLIDESDNIDADALLCQALDQALHALDLAESSAQPAPLSMANAEVARCHRAMGLLEPAEWYFQQALNWARVLGAVDSSVDLLCELADVAATRAASMSPQEERRFQMVLERARDHAFEAADMARQCADPHWEVNVLMRVSETLNQCGDHEDALVLQSRALHLIVQSNSGLSIDQLPMVQHGTRRRQN